MTLYYHVSLAIEMMNSGANWLRQSRNAGLLRI